MLQEDVANCIVLQCALHSFCCGPAHNILRRPGAQQGIHKVQACFAVGNTAEDAPAQQRTMMHRLAKQSQVVCRVAGGDVHHCAAAVGAFSGEGVEHRRCRLQRQRKRQCHQTLANTKGSQRAHNQPGRRCAQARQQLRHTVRAQHRQRKVKCERKTRGRPAPLKQRQLRQRLIRQQD